MKPINQRLSDLLSFLSLSQTEFAEKVQVDAPRISQYKTGIRQPKRDFLEKILEIFPQVNRVWLLDGQGEMLKTSSSYTETSDDNESLFQHVSEAPPPKPYASPASETVTHSHSPILPTYSSTTHEKKEKEITSVIIFYNDGTFEEIKKSFKK